MLTATINVPCYVNEHDSSENNERRQIIRRCGECVLDGLSLPMFKLPGGLNSFGFSNSNLDIKTLLLMF